MKRKRWIAGVLLLAVIFFLWAKRDSFTLEKQFRVMFADVVPSYVSILMVMPESDTPLLSVNADEKLSLGSITKLVTFCVASEYFEEQDLVTVGEEVDHYLTTDASRSMIKNGQQISFEHLVYAMFLPSGCDATYTVAVNAARRAAQNPSLPIPMAIRLFSDMMNAYGKKIGCVNSHFVNPDGQDHPGQYSSLSDMLLVYREAIKSDLLRRVIQTPSVDVTLASGETYHWANTNYLLDESSRYYYEYADGVKTGSTDAAGYALFSSAEKDGKRLYCILTGCKTSGERFRLSAKLYRAFFAWESVYGSFPVLSAPQ